MKTVCEIEKLDMSKSLSVLWLGNGINRTFAGDSWEQLISNALERSHQDISMEVIKKLPSNMQIIAATGDHVDVEMKNIAEDMKKQGDVAELQDFIKKNILPQKFDAIITTNYTYELEKTIDGAYSTSPSNKCRKLAVDVSNSSRKYMLHSYNQLMFDDAIKRIWHIHGEACTPGSMIMGNYYYGKLLGKIQSYISGRMSVLKQAYHHKLEFVPKSWIDYFLLGDVYVSGFGLDTSEMDFWWLACCKKRNFPDTNIYVYEPGLSKDSQLKILMDAYGIESITKTKSKDDDFYKKFHEFSYKEIGRCIG